MTKICTLALCSIVILGLACTESATGQSVAPNNKAPSAAQLELQRQIATRKRMVEQLKRELNNIKVVRDVADKKLMEIHKAEGESGVSIESFPEIVKNLQAKRIDLMIDMAGLEARREAIFAAEKANSSHAAIVQPLEKLVALKQAQLDKIRKSSAAPEEERAAQMGLLSSQVQLATAKSKKSSSTLLSDALLTTSLELAESKARLAKTDSLLANVLPARKQLESSKLLKDSALRALENENRISDDLRTVERQLEQLNSELQQLKRDEYLP